MQLKEQMYLFCKDGAPEKSGALLCRNETVFANRNPGSVAWSSVCVGPIGRRQWCRTTTIRLFNLVADDVGRLGRNTQHKEGGRLRRLGFGM
jgi:hypothetical protein